MTDYVRRASYFFKAISVEPIIFIYYFNIFIYALGTDNLFLQKNCMPEGPPQDTNAVCRDEKSLTIAAHITTLRSALRDCAPGITVLLAGVWRDRFGVSKPLLIYALCGEILSNIIVIIGYFYWSSSSWIISSVEGAIMTLTGGASMVLMAANCHIIDKTTTENRTERISYVTAAIEIGAFMGYGTSGLILSFLGYKYFFFAVIGLHLCSILLTVVLIKETPKSAEEGEIIPRLSAFKSVLKCSSNRAGAWMMIAASGSMSVILNGESNVMLYYLERVFKFSVTSAGLYSAYRIALPTVLSLIVSLIIMRILKIGDCKILIFSALLTLISTTSLAFANTELELILRLFFGFESLVSTYLPLGFLAVYDNVFGVTIRNFPGAFFFISSGLEFFILFVACVTLFVYGEPRNKCIENIEENSEPKYNVDLSRSHFEESQIDDS